MIFLLAYQDIDAGLCLFKAALSKKALILAHLIIVRNSSLTIEDVYAYLGVILCLVDIGNSNIMLMGCFIKGLERGGFLVSGLLDGFGRTSLGLRSMRPSITGSGRLK